jgi:hypothetical protein
MRQVPGGSWGRTWLATIVMFVTAAITLELFVRSRGYQPSIKEDDYAWALARRDASDHSPRTVAILGASRILLAFSPQAFRATLPEHRYVMLAQQGSAPIGTLRDLALDPDFRGVALVDIAEGGFDASNWHVQDHLLAAHRRGWRSAGQLAERTLTTAIQARLALLANHGLITVESLLETGRWPPPPYTTTYPDRTKFADYAKTDAERKRRIRLQLMEGWSPHLADRDRWLADALAQELYVALIHARGGHVVYVRMPTCDERWHADEVQMPKALFWDRLAELTMATTVHFKDHAALAGFPCPDTSHIDSKDGPAFTRGLLEVLIAKRVLPR